MQRASNVPPPPPSRAPAAGVSNPGTEDELPRQFGKYTLLRPLASGGMAKVYLAIQRAVAGFEKLVVIKRILPELSRDASFVEMLLTEAKTAATLNHPNVVQTFDVGEVDGTYYIAMEHINGEDIRSIVRGMRRRRVAEVPLEHTLAITLGVCAGLAYAHEKRDLDGRPLEIVHRDISPQNILVTFTGDVKIVDFGIAKTSEVAATEATSSGQLKGKVPYMSPEQARGRPIDHRSDIFAVGIMLFELTTGRRLFKAPSEYETLKLICEREYPRPSQIRPGYPAQLEAVVMRALAKNPDDRYASARDMQSDLEAFIRNERIAVSAVTLGKWMEMLFEDTIAEREATLQDVKQVADVIASRRSMPMSEGYGQTTTTTGATTLAEIHANQAAGQKGKLWMGVGAAMAAVAIVGAGLFFAMSGGSSDATTPVTPTPVSDAPAKKRGALVVHTDPPGAYVRVAGELQGDVTPTTIDKLPLDMEIEVKVSKDGYETQTRKVRFTDDELEEQLDLTLTRGTVTLTWKVVPKHALVVIDDKKWDGTDNRAEDLSTGEHKIVFSAPGHLPKVVKFTAKKGETKEVDVKLMRGDPKAIAKKQPDEPEPTTPTPEPPPPPPEPPPKPKPAGPPGTLNINSRGGYCSNVLVNGRSVGPTPVAGVSVPPGPVSILCKLGDGRTIPWGAQVKSGQTSRVTISIPEG